MAAAPFPAPSPWRSSPPNPARTAAAGAAPRWLFPSGSGENRSCGGCGCRAGDAPPLCLQMRAHLLSLAPSSAGAGAAARRRPVDLPSPPDLMVRPPRFLADLDTKDCSEEEGRTARANELSHRSLRELRRTPLAFCAGERPLPQISREVRESSKQEVLNFMVCKYAMVSRKSKKSFEWRMHKQKALAGNECLRSLMRKSLLLGSECYAR